eukprot:gene5270-5936_t
MLSSSATYTTIYVTSQSHVMLMWFELTKLYVFEFSDCDEEPSYTRACGMTKPSRVSVFRSVRAYYGPIFMRQIQEFSILQRLKGLKQLGRHWQLGFKEISCRKEYSLRKEALQNGNARRSIVANPSEEHERAGCAAQRYEDLIHKRMKMRGVGRCHRDAAPVEVNKCLGNKMFWSVASFGTFAETVGNFLTATEENVCQEGLSTLVPTRFVDSLVTPFEIWYEKKPDVSHVRIFGCLAYALKSDVAHRKLDGKLQKLRFVEYDLNAKMYRLADESGRL